MKSFCSIITVIILTVSLAMAQLSGNLSGVLQGNTTYQVTGNITVQGGDSLIIEPGAVLIFSEGTQLIINGYLYAVGMEMDSIKFINNQGITWSGMIFNDSASDSCRLDYCVITGGNSFGVYPENSGGGICCLSSSPTISNCTITGNSAVYGGGIFCYLSNAVIYNSVINANLANLDGGGIYNDNCDLLISNSQIIGNTANKRSGGIHCETYTNPEIVKCLIANNTAAYDGGGISCMNYSTPYISNCTITGNYAGDQGGGIYCHQSISTIVNCILEGNSGNNGIYLYLSPATTMDYCNFYFNEMGNIFNPPSGVGQQISINAQGDSCDLHMNIFENPLFVDKQNCDFHLQASSPCIDAGAPASGLDPDGTIADIGTFYFDQESNSFEVRLKAKITIGIGYSFIDDGNIARFWPTAVDGFGGILEDGPKQPYYPSNYLYLAFPHPEWGTPYCHFKIDTRNSNDDLTDAVKSFYYYILTDQIGEETELTFTPCDFFPDGYGLVMHDITNSTWQNLKEDSAYTFIVTEDTTKFNLIIGDCAAPVVDITFPASGTQLIPGQAYNLIWNYTDVSEIRQAEIYYSYDEGINWTLINTIASGAETYNWTVPADTGSTNCLIKIVAEDWPGNVGEGISCQFSIGGPPQIDITSPAVDEIWFFNDANDITWNTTFVGAENDTTIVYISKDDGYTWNEITALLTANPLSYTYTVPDTFSSYSKVKVYVKDTNGFSNIAITDYTFNTAPDEMECLFDNYIKLFTIPLTPVNNSISAVIGDDLTEFYFPCLQGSNIYIGEAYWIIYSDSAIVDIDGAPEVDSYNMDLNWFWNDIGTPIPTTINKLNLQFTNGVDTLFFADAVSEGWIINSIFSYNNDISSFELSTVLEPWEGYILFALNWNLTMLVSAPYPGGGMDEILDPFQPDWIVPVVVKQGSTVNKLAGFGMCSEADDGVDYGFDVPVPPDSPNGEYLRVYTDHPEWDALTGDKFCQDIRKSFANENEAAYASWTFIIESSDTGKTILAFKDLVENLPEGYSAVIYFNDRNVSLMEQRVFNFKYDAPIEFTVRIFNKAATISGYLLNGEFNFNFPTEYSICSIYPNPFNPVTILNYALPKASHVNLTVYDINGRETTLLFDGFKPAGEYEAVFDGKGLSSGMYFVRMTAGDFTQTKKLLLIK